MRRILHIDMDAFYASVEQQDNPALAGKPVIVGADPKRGHGRGVVAACSYEARRFGIHSALPISQAWKLCPNGVYLSPRLERYRAVSGSIMEIFHRYTDLVEPLSIDEAFLDVTGSERLLGPCETIARDIKTEIRSHTGLTASVGIASNKFLAKLASDLEKPDGFVTVPDEGIREFLSPLPIRRLWGVGPRTAGRLQKLGLRTVGQVGAMPRTELVRHLGSHGEHLWDLAQGQDSRPVSARGEPRSISSETTFTEDVRDVGQLTQTLRHLAGKVAHRLRAQGYRARTVRLKLRFASFATYSRQVSEDDRFDTGEEVFALAVGLFRRFRLTEPVRLLGIGVSDLVNDSHARTQLSLFENRDARRDLDRLVDEVQERYGESSIQRASEMH